jgi:hypothetical protein
MRQTFWLSSILIVCASSLTYGSELSHIDAEVSFSARYSDPRSVENAWAVVQAVARDRISLDSAVARQAGWPALRFEVRAGDNPLRCCEGTERTEVAHIRGAGGERISENSRSGTQFLATSIRLSPDYRSPEQNSGEWAVFLQLHGPDTLTAPPVFALRTNRERFYVMLNGGDLNRGARFTRIEFTDGELNRGRWVDFVFRIHFSDDTSGSIVVWRRNEGEAVFRAVASREGVPTLQFNQGRGIGVGEHYWKAGMYRSASPFTTVHWMGPLVRATTFESAEFAAFGTRSGILQ